MNDLNATEKHKQICELVYRSKEFFNFLDPIINENVTNKDVAKTLKGAISTLRFFTTIMTFDLEDESMQTLYDKGKSIVESKDLKYKETRIMPKIFYKSKNGCVYELCIEQIHQTTAGGFMRIYTFGGPELNENEAC